MPSPYNITNIPAPRVDFIDPRTGLMAREWYRFFFNLFNLTGAGTTDTSLADLQVGPPAINDLLGELGITYDQAQLAAMMAQYEQATLNIQNQLDTAPAQPQLGTLSAVNEDNVRLIGFSTNPSPAVPNPAPTGTLYWDGNSTLGLQMNQNVVAMLGQSQFTYVKASSAITKGQLCKHTGAVGGSGVITAAPTSINMTDPNQIIGVAAQDIALNGFGFIQDSGDLRGFNTTGASVGETWADGDPLYYNPAYVGAFTNVKPSAPNLKSYIGEVINAGAGGSGSISVRLQPGSVLGGTDSNVQFGTLADKDLIQYDSTAQYWKNVSPSTISVGTATNLAGGAAGSVPYQSGAGATTFLSIGTAGQYARVNAGATAPEWASPAALTKTDDTNVTLTLGGNPTTALLNAASITVGWTGTLAATRLNANVVQAVTNDTNVTGSISAQTLTLGWTGTLAAARLNANVVQAVTNDTNVTGSIATQTLTLAWSGQLAVSRGGTGTGTAFTTGSVVFANASGIYAQNNAQFFWDNTNNRLGIGTASPAVKLDVTGAAAFSTSATTPIVIGGTGTTSTLTLRSTSGVGATGADIVFQVGNNGATEAMRIINAGNAVGIGLTPNAWGANWRVLELSSSSSGQAFAGLYPIVIANAYSDGTNYIYKTSAAASYTSQVTGTHRWYTAASGTAGNTVTFSEIMRLDASGNLGIGTSSPAARVHLAGALTASAWTTNGVGVRVAAATYTDSSTAASGTVASSGVHAIAQPTIASTNATVTYTDAATFYVANSPANGSNVTVTNPWSVWVAAGNARFDGNLLLKGTTSALGYGTGSGGAVTQATSRTTGVTLNKTNGAITLVSAAGTATYQTFTVTNSTVAATDTIVVNQKSGTDKYIILVTAVAAGSFNITFATTGGTTTEQPVFNFAVIKAVTA